MSGYLQRLVERTMGEASVVQPRIAPRFASGPALVVESAVVREGTEQAPQEAASPSRTQVMPPPAPAQPVDSQTDLATPAAIVPQKNKTGTMPVSIEPRPSTGALAVDPQETLPASRQPVESGEGSDQPGQVEMIAEKSPQPDRAAPREPEVNDERYTITASNERVEDAHPERFIGVQVSPRVIKADIHASQREGGGRDSQLPETSGQAVDTTIPVPNSVPAAREGDAAKPREAAGAAVSPTLPVHSETVIERGDQPSPVIRVTIGRIEVRAITPPAPTPRPAASRPKPALTLQEYLKQRNGGDQ